MAMTKSGSIPVPNAGTSDANYPAPTPHAASVSHQVYEAPTATSDSDGNIPFGLNESSDGSAGSAVDGITVAPNAGWTPATTQSQGLLDPSGPHNDLNAAQGSVKAYEAMAGLSGPNNISTKKTGFGQGSSAVAAATGTPRNDGIQFGSPGTYGYDNP